MLPQAPGFTPSYDANGNVLNDNSHIYTWDAEGRPVTIDGVGLTYDALGRMVEQNRSGAYTQILYAPSGGKLALMNGQTLQKAFVPLPGNGTAAYNASGLSYYRHPDWLGSSRFASTPARGMYSSTAYAPFGEPYAQAGTTDLSFTGQNQDTVGGSYDFLFREYSIQGRWPSPDPAGLGAVDLSDPRSLNRYAYVRNNPLGLVDPLGLQGCDTVTCVVDTDGSDQSNVFLIDFFFNWFFRGPRGDFPRERPDKPDRGDKPKPRRTVAQTIKAAVKTTVCAVTQPLQDAAHANQGAVGAGLGGSAAVGFITGVSVAAGVQVVADPQGNIGIAFAGGGNPGFPVVVGTGAIGGAQFTSSTARTIFDLRGVSSAFGASVGTGAGAGVDVSNSRTASSFTVTAGFAAGGKITGGFNIVGTAVPAFLSTSCR